MKGGILEVLLVNAHGIKHTNIIGRPVYYVIIQCGTKECRSKISKGEYDSATWNQKFVFRFPLSQWRNMPYIKFRIMDKEFFNDGGFVGETIIHLGGILTEGSDRGYIEVMPAPYNVVLDDATYKGEIKIGFKFFALEKLQGQPWEANVEGKGTKDSTVPPIMNIWKLPLLKFLLYCFKKSAKYRLKEN
ncbi:PREDICTED: elicitor-responsive protein 3 [Tarenaya hassleriana]|uniref:elicitor-responsive protein 3 n=1 Tax=Tarenaya hassleriana TaxID=28532 RepID=UPI00053C51DD|nr:PREDICTED: elicitor-responsive protein 3 [Tarenaya hassleriana]XP_010523019.1 PREDICTED: elicitor-responsive protein 3 [Tarenaya hassleriana]